MARLMLTRGVEGLTMRAIAEGTGIAPSTLVAQFTHRRRLLAWFCSRTCRARARHWERRIDRHRLAGLLPWDEEALETERIWSGLREVCRWREDLGEVVRDVDEDERRLVAHVLAHREHDRKHDREHDRKHDRKHDPEHDRECGGPTGPGPVWRPDPGEVTLLTAVLAGLRTAMVRPVEPLALRDAVRVLERCAGEDAAHLLRE